MVLVIIASFKVGSIRSLDGAFAKTNLRIRVASILNIFNFFLISMHRKYGMRLFECHNSAIKFPLNV